MLNNSAEQIIFNYNFIPRDELKTCKTTRCIIIYEVVRLINGIPLFWEGHWTRLQNSIKAVGFRVKIDKIKFEQSLSDLIKQNSYLNTNIRIEVFEKNILVYAIHAEYPTNLDYEHGVNVNFTEAIRKNPTRKILRRTWKKTMERKINNAGMSELLLVNPEGLITEGSHTNVFFIRENKLYSAHESLILPGITRLEVMKIAAAENIQLEYLGIKKESITVYEAAFLCATSLHILPIARINDQSYDVNNSTLRFLMNAFDNHLELEIKKASLKWRI